MEVLHRDQGHEQHNLVRGLVDVCQVKARRGAFRADMHHHLRPMIMAVYFVFKGDGAFGGGALAEPTVSLPTAVLILWTQPPLKTATHVIPATRNKTKSEAAQATDGQRHVRRDHVLGRVGCCTSRYPVTTFFRGDVPCRTGGPSHVVKRTRGRERIVEGRRCLYFIRKRITKSLRHAWLRMCWGCQATAGCRGAPDSLTHR